MSGGIVGAAAVVLAVVTLAVLAAVGLGLAVRTRAQRLSGAVTVLRGDLDAGLARLRDLRRARARRDAAP